MRWSARFDAARLGRFRRYTPAHRQGTERDRGPHAVLTDRFPRRQPSVVQAFDEPDPERPARQDQAAFEVRWRARLVAGSGGHAAGRFSRVVDELADTRWIRNPTFDFEAGETFVMFTFHVERVSYVAAAVDLARRALDDALANAKVGAPYPPTSTTLTHVSVVLEAQPLSVEPTAA